MEGEKKSKKTTEINQSAQIQLGKESAKQINKLIEKSTVMS